jgi:HNH endonuclease
MGKALGALRRWENRVRRFWAKVGRSGDGCWPWLGTQTSAGYGRVMVFGRRMYAHRFALQLALGRQLGAGELVCHRCDNPKCVRPDHLFVGSQTDNMRDASDKGRCRPWGRQRTHCKRGHELPHGPGVRRCVRCNTLRNVDYRARRRGTFATPQDDAVPGAEAGDTPRDSSVPPETMRDGNGVTFGATVPQKSRAKRPTPEGR